MITVFTPTYNRDYIIRNLYDSLCRQTCMDFEWLVVDDGSTDNTGETIKYFSSEKKVTIRYFKQANGGKHRAINKGVREARGDYFLIVDSDDYLSDNAIESVIQLCEQIKGKPSFAGVAGIKMLFSGKRVGSELGFTTLDCSPFELTFKYHVKGDLAEVFRTNVLKEFPFPEFDGENFCAESIVWNRISQKYILRYTDMPFYFCEYREDGLSAKSIRLRMSSPRHSMLFYSELRKMTLSFPQKLKAIINYWRFAICSKDSLSFKITQIGKPALLLYPIGFFVHLKDLYT